MPATLDELISVASAPREYGGVRQPHPRWRDQTRRWTKPSCRGAAWHAPPVLISHHKLIGPRKSWPVEAETLAHIGRVACQRQEVALDCYPHAAGSTILRKCTGWR